MSYPLPIKALILTINIQLITSMPKKALLVSHQLDFSGAPIALLQLAKVLKKIGWEVDLYSLLGEGELSDQFKEIGVNVTTEKFLEIHFQPYQLVVFNTVVSTQSIPNLKPINAKWILWIHESPYLAGFAWSPLVNMSKIHSIDLLIFPSNSCKHEWGSFINAANSFVIPSPVDIPINIIKINQNISNKHRTYCIIDPRESYRNINKIEDAILSYSNNAIFNFVGAEPPSLAILNKLKSKKNIQVNYFGRISRSQALEILARSDIYLSATCLATQNRGLCEALTLNKTVLVSRIMTHLEIGGKAGIPEDSYFYPLQNINLNLKLIEANYKTNFLEPPAFECSIRSLLDSLYPSQISSLKTLSSAFPHNFGR